MIDEKLRIVRYWNERMGVSGTKIDGLAGNWTNASLGHFFVLSLGCYEFKSLAHDNGRWHATMNAGTTTMDVGS